MSMPAMVPRRRDESWRTPGCGPRCRSEWVTFPGRRYPERLPLHDPYHHEAYGEVRAAYNDVAPRAITRTGRLVVDTVTARATVDGADVALTPIEWGLLAYLAATVGQVCMGIDVLRAVWGPSHSPRPARIVGGRLHHPDLHLLRTHLARLRRKLGVAGRLIQTRPGMGYMLVEEPAS